MERSYFVIVQRDVALFRMKTESGQSFLRSLQNAGLVENSGLFLWSLTSVRLDAVVRQVSQHCAVVYTVRQDGRWLREKDV